MTAEISQAAIEELKALVGASGWVSEDELVETAPPFEVLPDSMLLDPKGVVRLVVEFAGIYDAKRLRRIHDYAENRELPYELW